MTPDQLIALLHRHWAQTLAALDAEERVQLLRRVGELGDAEGRGPTRRAAREVGRMLSRLPAQHPVGAALHDAVRYAGQDTGRDLVVDRDRLSDLLGFLSGPPPTAEEILDATRQRLLDTPARGSETALTAVTGAGAEDLIRLHHPELGDRYPEFQFLPGTDELRPVVREVNRLLLAGQDPWGAADWWLGGNEWLDGVPADLLYDVPDELILTAARALVEDD
ncbi:hypothetical protein ABT275_16805 [Streptomyces sp. NPDC001185]|uniref:hypothetical protein n=1 Tax=Streptomyces sp. NPDC001185 TaxID=3154380 RepID=UPI0033242A60